MLGVGLPSFKLNLSTDGLGMMHALCSCETVSSDCFTMLPKVAWLIINRHSIPPWHPQVVNASAVRASMTTSPTTATTLPPLILLLPNLVSGHHIAQLRLIFHAVPSRRAPNSPGTDLFLVMLSVSKLYLSFFQMV